MTVFSESELYRNNALMNANPFFLGMALLMFGMFNMIFVGGFFKTAYRFSKPFVTYIIVCFLLCVFDYSAEVFCECLDLLFLGIRIQ